MNVLILLIVLIWCFPLEYVYSVAWHYEDPVPGRLGMEMLSFLRFLSIHALDLVNADIQCLMDVYQVDLPILIGVTSPNLPKQISL
jgi:hypothetical protein